MAIRVELELDTGEFTTRVLRAGQSLQDLETRVGHMVTSVREAGDQTRGFLSTMRDVSVVFGAATLAIGTIRSAMSGWVGSIIKVNAEMERTTALMKSLAKSSDAAKEAAENVNYLRQMAVQAPFGIHAMGEAFVRLKSTGIDPMKGSMQALVDGVAAFGGSEDVLKRASVALSQMAGKGVVQMEELRQQLGEAVPRATELMARAMGLSYAELIKKVSTGTLDAVTSINALNLEMERVYGGAALAQMRTFNGMLATTEQQWQRLALRVGEGGFMSALKTQLDDFNNFLKGNVADILADRVGSALTGSISALRASLDFVVRYRQEIMLLGQAFVTAFAVSKLISFSQAFVGMLGNFRQSLQLVSLEAQNFSRSMQFAQMGRAISTLTNGAQGISLFGQAMVFASGGVRLLGVAISSIAPWLPLLAFAVIGVGEAFGLFSNKARDAWQELEEFGVQSRKQVNEAGGYLQQLKRELAGLDNATNVELDSAGLEGEAREVARAAIERQNGAVELRKKIAGMEVQYARFTTQAEQIEAKKAADARIEEMNRAMDTIRLGYDKQAIDEQKFHEKQLAELAKAGKSGVAEDDRYKVQQRQTALKFYEDQLKILDDYYTQAKAMGDMSRSERDDPGAKDRAELARNLQLRIAQQRQAVQASLDMQRNAPLGAITIQTAKDDTKLYDKGLEKLAQVKGEIEGLQDALGGASNKAEQLYLQFQRGKFGDIGTERVQDLRDALVEAQKEKEKLDELMKGKKELENDLDNLRIKNLQEIAELQAKIAGRQLSDYEKLRIKATNGGYSGVLPGQDALTVFSNTTKEFRATNDAAQTVGVTIQNNTFGSTTISKGQTMLDQILQITTAWDTLKNSVANTNFGGAFGTFNGPGGGMMNVSNAAPMKGGMIYNQMLPVVAKAFLMAVQSVESGGAPNIRYGGAGGSKYFSDFSDHPRIKEVIPSGPNAGKTSDAAGTYQFLSSTWDRLGGGAFTPDRQEAMAWKLAQQDYASRTGGRSLLDDLQNGGLTPEILSKMAPTWEGFQKSGGKAIATYNNSMNSGFPVGEPQKMSLQQKDDAAASTSRTVEQLKVDSKIQDALKDLGINADKAKEMLAGMGKSLKGTGDDADETGKRVAALTAKIKAGELDPNDKDPASERYKKLMAAAKEADRVEDELARKKKARTAAAAADDKMAKTKEELDLKMKSLQARIADPNSPKTSDGYISLKADLDKQTQAAEAFYGKDTAEYQAFLTRKKALLEQYLNADAMTSAAKLAGDNQKLQRSLMTEGQSRKAALDAEIKRLQDLVANSQATGEARVALEKQVQERIALLRQQYDTQAGPLGKQMKEWSAFGDNLEKAATGWLDSGVDAIAQFVATGKMNFSQLAQSIIADITKIALKAAISNMMGKGGGGGKSGGKSGASAKSGKSFLKMFGFGAAHIGGIVGATTMTRHVSPFAFAGAPRYHTGGVLSGLGLGPDEVPIIAKKDEGIFTPKQMKAMGRSGAVSNQQNNVVLNSNINVNAQGGTKEQNQDAADRTAKAIEGQVRAIVGDEIIKQMRPGNAIYQAAKSNRR